jgi:hypothetical protein
VPRRPDPGPGWDPAGAGPEAGFWVSGAQIGEIWVWDLGFGPKATFSALSEAEMRFFKTHGFVKPLLREMLFLLVCLVFRSLSKRSAKIFVNPLWKRFGARGDPDKRSVRKTWTL